MRANSLIWSLCCLWAGVSLMSVAQESAPPAPGAAQAKPAYRVEVHVFRILPAVEGSGEGHAGGGPALAVMENGKPVLVPKPGETVASIFGSAVELQVPGERWTLDRNGLSRTGSNAPSKALVQAVSSPSILLPLGERAEIRMGLDGAQYFERVEDGIFALRTLNEFVGYAFECTLSPSAHMEGALSLRIASTLRETGDREPVPGLSLNVGRPAIRESKFDTNIQLKPNDWMGSVSRTEDGAMLLTLVSIHETGS